jgi:hypothetical protein
MIAKAAGIIKQLNDLIYELQRDENPELNKKKSQLSAINRSIQYMEIEGLEISTELLKLKEQLVSEKKKFDDPEEILDFIKNQLKTTIKNIDYGNFTESKKQYLKTKIKVKKSSLKSEPISEREWIGIPESEKKRYKMTFKDGIITPIDIYGETHKCKSLNALRRHERGEGHKRKRV